MIKKIIRITTVPISLKLLLKGQLKYMSDHFDMLAISSPDGNKLKEIEEEEHVRTVPVMMTRKITPLKDMIALLKLIRVIKREHPMIVHTHTPKAGLLGMLAAKIARVPIRLHTVAGLPLMTAKGSKKRLLLFIEKLTYFSATGIYPNSNNMKEYILKMNLTKSKKLKIIADGSSNGIDTEHFKLSEEMINEGKNFRLSYKIPENSFVYLFVGRIVKDKGINELIKAYNKLGVKNSYLVLTGDFETELNPIDSENYDAIKTSETIIHTGFKEDVRPIYAAANAFVFPSHREGFPNVVLQACAMRLPIIVSDINGSNEIINQRHNGLIVGVDRENELKDAMKELYDNPGLCTNLAQNAEHSVREKYSNTRIWEAILNEYQTLIDQYENRNTKY